jgi:hypothetical protein
MRYLIGLITLTLIGCASTQATRESHANADVMMTTTATPSFVGHWISQGPGDKESLDVRADGTFDGIDDGEAVSGKWKATSPTSANFIEEHGQSAVRAELSGRNEMLLTSPEEPAARFKRQP